MTSALQAARDRVLNYVEAVEHLELPADNAKLTRLLDDVVEAVRVERGLPF